VSEPGYRGETSYRFSPHPSSGFILGLRVSQLCGLIAGGLGALVALRAHGLAGLALALLVLAVAAALLLIPIHGQTIEQWAPTAIRFASTRLNGQARFRSPRAQLGHLVALPAAGGLDPRPAAPPDARPAELVGVELVEVALARYDGARLGVVKDRRAATFTATVRVSGRAFALLSPDEREARLEEYGAVLAALARDDSPVRRVAWIERTLPADSDALGAYLLEAKRRDVSLDDLPGELVSYLQLIGRAAAVAQAHELLFSVQVDARRPWAKRAIARMGGGDLGALAVLAGEVGQLIELLDEAGITVTGLLTRAGLAAAIRAGYDPWGDRQRQRQLRAAGDGDPGIAAHTIAPTARDEHWGRLAVDGALHCTLWVAEWPRIDVRALFLQPLLMDTTATRSVAMVMELVGPGRATRRAERAATEAATEQSLRARVGQRTTQRQAQRDLAAARRERELAEGHAAVRYAAYVTVSVPNHSPTAVDELETAVSRVELEAKRAPLRLERMWGQQAEAFTFSLPLARGLK
jgi:hypothetical protein